MDTNYTHIAMVIDRSGSMGSCWNDVTGGYAEIVKSNKEAEGKCTFTVAAFDTEYDLLEDFTDIKDVSEFLDVTPRGGTALLDAIGRTIVSVGEKLAAMEESQRPMKVCVIIQTDGEENASREYTKDAIKKMIEEQTNTYKWEFQFIGASMDAVQDAQTWGIRASNVAQYDTTNSYASFTLLGEKMKHMRSATTLDAYTNCAAFSDEDREVLSKSDNSI